MCSKPYGPPRRSGRASAEAAAHAKGAVTRGAGKPRKTGEGQGASADSPLGGAEILTALDLAVSELMAWLKAWHRSKLCGSGAESMAFGSDPSDLGRFGIWYARNQHRGLVNQPAVRRLAQLQQEIHEEAHALSVRHRPGQPLPRDAYDALMDKVLQFVAAARRMEKAFVAASAHLDALTGLHNRETMEHELERERERSLRSNRPCTIAIADLDHFKAINDRYGHVAGDHVLAAAADTLLIGLRPYDTVYRYGGEEFLICLPDTSLLTAAQILERLRQQIEELRIPSNTDATISVTCSFGVAALASGDRTGTAIKRADQALYRAKQGGRNRICAADDHDEGS